LLYFVFGINNLTIRITNSGFYQREFQRKVGFLW